MFLLITQILPEDKSQQVHPYLLYLHAIISIMTTLKMNVSFPFIYRYNYSSIRTWTSLKTEIDTSYENYIKSIKKNMCNVPQKYRE